LFFKPASNVKLGVICGGLLLLGCSQSRLSHEQQVVQEHIRRSMQRAGTDADSYYSVSWDIQPLSRGDSVR
jgi:hypothetical protein